MYKITVTVNDDQLGDAIKALTPHSATPLAIIHVGAPSQPKKTGRDKTRHSPVSETRSGRVVLEALETGPCSREEVSTALVAAGFAPGSVSPLTSALAREGLISAIGSKANRSWELVR